MLSLLLGLLLWFNFAQDSSAAAFAQRTYDLADPRRARSILIIGNSRTYYHSMPSMVRRIADSANSPAKWQIETIAKPGFTLECHWADPRTRRMLQTGWDDVILQGASAEVSSLDGAKGLVAHGQKLASIAKLNGGYPRIVVNWAYDPSLYEGDSSNRVRHLAGIDYAYARLAREAGLARINLAGLWEFVRQSHPSIRLTTDGNHPTLAGSYLYALAIYSHLSSGPVTNVTYVPDGLDPEAAEALRSAVDRYPRLML
jgi:hypothetical protein